MNETWQSYWNNFAQVFAYPLKADELLGKFIANTAITGTYAEAWIRKVAKSMLPQYRISSGAIIRASDQDRDLRTIPQVDLIIWQPSELPALFEIDDFAIVPNFSARAIIEVKHTCTDLSALDQQLNKQQKCLPHEFRKYILCVVISHPKPLFDGQVSPDWLKQKRGKSAITRLLDANHEVDAEGLFVFIYFLAQIAGHSRLTT